MFSGNIYTFNNGSKQVNNAKQGDIVYNSVDNEFVTINNVSTRYEPILELNVFKTRPIQLTRNNQVLTIQKNDNNTYKPVWKNIDELTIKDYVAITTKKLSTAKVADNDDDISLDDYKYLLMGIYISCGEMCYSSNKLMFKLCRYMTLYNFSDDEGEGKKDIQLVIDIIDTLFNIKKYDIKYDDDNDDYDNYHNYLSFELTDELINFVNNIDNEILNIDNYFKLHQVVKGMHFNHTLTKYKLTANLKNIEDSNKYYNILRNYGMDVGITNSSLEFNSIYVVNMNDMDPNDPAMCSSPSVISCFYNDPNKYYSIDYTFLKVMSVVDKYKYEKVSFFDTDNKCYNVENVLIK